MEEEDSKDIREYFAILRRRKGLILAVTAILAAVTLALAIGLPPVYRSSATILVQEQEVPPDLVRSTITSFADERIQVISQQVMTRAVLQQMIDKFGLYAKYRGRLTSEEILERMRKAIILTTVDASISDRSSGRRVNATIAFQISFDAPRPEPAQQVVNELVTLYLNENVKARQQSVAETTAFLTQEADRLASQIQEIESNLAEFKRRNAGRMPDSSVVNMQLADRANSELSRVEREISVLQDRKLSLEAQLLMIKPYTTPATTPGGERGLTPEERLRSLQAQYTSSAAVYGADHPDIRRMKREIDTLRAETGASGRDAGDAQKLRELEAELAKLKERYAEDHPDVQRLTRSITALKATGARTAAGANEPDKRLVFDPIQRADNPAYIALASQLESTKRELAQLMGHRGDLRNKQGTYDARLLQIPNIEREYRDLTRDYDNAQTRYREIKAKQMQAEVAQELEKGRKAERFSLGEPPQLPQKPISPKRMQIVLIGFVASLGTGLGLAWLRDAIDPSIKGPLELARIARVPLLTGIPYIHTGRERIGARRRHSAVFILVALLAIAFVVVVHVFLKPFPEILDAVARQLIFW